MLEAELVPVVECALCHELVSPEWGTCYSFGDDEVLCFECGLRKGGRFDSAGEGWVVAPDVTELSVVHALRARPPAAPPPSRASV